MDYLQSDSHQYSELCALTPIRVPDHGVPRLEVSDSERGGEWAPIVLTSGDVCDRSQRGEPCNKI
jgi:hypothetical protein